MKILKAATTARVAPADLRSMVRTSVCLHDADPEVRRAETAPILVDDASGNHEPAEEVAGARGVMSGAAGLGAPTAGTIATAVSAAEAFVRAAPREARVSHVDDTRRTIRVYVDGVAFPEGAAPALPVCVAGVRTLARPAKFVLDPGSRYYIRPGDTMQAAAHKVFRRLYSDALSRRDGVLRDTDIEDLHKFRVATRRLRAALKAFRPVFGRAALHDATTVSRALARATNRARDLDVFIEALDADLSCADIPVFMTHVRAERQDAIRTTLVAVDGVAFDEYCGAVERLLGESHPMGRASGKRKATRRARNEAPRMVRRRLAAVMKYEADLDAASDVQRHDLRIAAKQLRYVAEFFADVLPPPSAELVEQMKAMQDSLGDANDCAVQTAYVEAAVQGATAVTNLPDEERVALRRLIAAMDARRQHALLLFRRQWDDFAHVARRLLSDGINPPQA